MNNHRILVVLVTYFPDMDALRANLLTLVKLGLRVTLFDNTPYSLPGMSDVMFRLCNERDFSSIMFQGNGKNIGLSKAYNEVLRQYLNSPEIDGFLFLDQDSMLAEHSVQRLIDSFYTLNNTNTLGVIGGYPIINNHTQYRFNVIKDTNIPIAGCNATYMVPSSFSIIPRRVLKKVGLFYDDFFIDHIDMDFCLRARRAGLLVVFDSEATFLHTVGCGSVLLFGKYISPVSAPFRHYFQVRNNILSYKRLGYGKREIVHEILKRLTVIFLQALLKGAFIERCRYASWGLIDGIRGKSGELPPGLIKTKTPAR